MSGFVVQQNFKSYLVVQVKTKQHLDPLLMELKKSVLGRFNESFFQGSLCVSEMDDFRN